MHINFRPKGGFGNQIYQLFFLFSLLDKFSIDIKFVRLYFPYYIIQPSCHGDTRMLSKLILQSFHTDLPKGFYIFKHFFDLVPEYMQKTILKVITLTSLPVFRDYFTSKQYLLGNDFDFNRNSQASMLPSNLVVDGYFQDIDCAQDIFSKQTVYRSAKKILFMLNDYVTQLSSVSLDLNGLNISQLVAIHIRCGDFLRLRPDLLPAPHLVRTMLDSIIQEDNCYIVFTDTPEYVSNNYNIPFEKIANLEMPPELCLYYFINSKILYHGHSSFSKFAAYLRSLDNKPSFNYSEQTD